MGFCKVVMDKKISSFSYNNFLIHHYQELESTNNTALELVKNLQIFDREIICSDIQIKGRGRNNGNWISPQGNLYFSLVLDGKKIAIQNLHQISYVASVSLNQAISKLALANDLNLTIENKWPNDLIINNFKVAGILLETIIDNNFCQSIILGIGVNISNNPVLVANNLSVILANNLNYFEIKIEAIELLKKFLDEFEYFLNIWLNFGFKNIRKLWLEKAYLLGKEIKLSKYNQTGIFKEIDQDGNLILQQNQAIQKFNSADLW